MNPNAPHPTSLVSLVQSIWKHRQLIVRMTKREVVGRYKGSALGLLWSFINPLFMLAIYTFVFSVVFKARFGTGSDENKAQFALVLFAGLIVHGLFAEMLIRSAGLILNNVNYVKKVIFPLEILPVISLGGALFHSLASLTILALCIIIFNGSLPWTAIFLPLVFMPLIIFSLGIAWIVAAVTVYVRDTEQTIGLLTTVLMFLSPVFFPVSALPEKYRYWIMLNPLTSIIEQTRAVLIYGQFPMWGSLAVYTMVAILVLWLGFSWFQKTRKGFADVL